MTGHNKENIMASVYKEISLDARPEDVWAALRDYGAVHRRVAPGFVTDCRLDGDARMVTFANGNVAQELLVTMDDARMRLVYAVVNPRVKQHSASFQVFPAGAGRHRAGSRTAPRSRGSPTARAAAAWCGSPMCWRTRSGLISTARWIWARRRCR